MSSDHWSADLPSEESVVELAGHFVPCLSTPLVFYLRGELGAGKTTFARALIQSLGYSGKVKSPSYGLLEAYEINDINVLHLDLYRLENPSELEYLALRDLFDIKSILLVEWPEKGAGFLPLADLDIRFDEAQSQRFARISAATITGQNLLENVTKSIAKPFLE